MVAGLRIAKTMPSDAEMHFRPPLSEVLFFPFVDGGVLFRKGGRRIWFLNRTAAVIWCLLDQATDIEGLITQYSLGFSVERVAAEHDVQVTLDFFRQEGLLGEDVPPVAEIREDPVDFAWGPQTAGPPPGEVCLVFCIAGHYCEFRCENTILARQFASLMGHLATSGRGTRLTSLWVFSEPGRKDSWNIVIDGRIAAWAVPFDMVLPHLLTLAFAAVSIAMTDKLLFHAAVIKKEGTAILFPAEAGKGKTTLAAFLASQGNIFFSDELAILDVQRLTVLPCPLPMSVKSGSVGVLSPYYPDLPKLAAYIRADAKEVRYLLPPLASMAPITDVARVGAIVFPQFSANADSRISALDKATALALLVRTGSSDRDLDPVDISAMIRLVENSPCFELIFSDIEEAGYLLEKDVFSCLPGSN